MALSDWHSQVSCLFPSLPSLLLPTWLANYTFGTKEPQPEEDASVTARMERLEKDFSVNGMRRSVDAVMVVHDHGHPHVLMFQIAAQFYKLYV